MFRLHVLTHLVGTLEVNPAARDYEAEVRNPMISPHVVCQRLAVRIRKTAADVLGHAVSDRTSTIYSFDSLRRSPISSVHDCSHVPRARNPL